MKKTVQGIAAIGLIGALALAMTACSSKPKSSANSSSSTTPTSSSPASSAPSVAPSSSSAPVGSPSAASTGSAKLCMVLDTGGVDDKSFNQSSWEGLQAAAKTNPNISPTYVASNSSNDYTPNLTAQTNASCDTIIAVGGLMADNVKKIAAANPNQHYAEIDNPSTGSNVYGLEFNTAQGGFLGGYLAAAMSKSGTVGTWGGLNIPPVTIYMDGFWEGVQYYNKQNGKSVKVLGWDETNQKGGKLNLIWVDTDGYESAAQYGKYFITSVTKGLSQAVQDYMKQVGSGSFPSGNWVGTLQNGGTGLAPFHDFDSKVPQDVKDTLSKITSDIESGTIKITSPSQPQ